jgi:maleate isomerase
MSERKLLGMLVPSSNTVLEPTCAAMLAGVANVSAHFARFRVTEISLAAAALDQFQFQPMLEAAALLADAKVDSVCWNGTSASWLGLDTDRSLCSSIKARTGIDATSAVLALEHIFRQTGVRRFGLISPYLPDVQSQIVMTLRAEGFECIAERHSGLRDNFSFSEVRPEDLTIMVREVARERPQAITLLCTNLRGAPLVEELEQEIGLPIYDSVAVALWGSMRAAQVNPACIKGWGSLFRDLR